MKAIFFAVLVMVLGNGVSVSGAGRETVGVVILEPSDVEPPFAADKAKDDADLQKMREISRILRETTIPKVVFRDAYLDEALDFLSKKAGVRFINALFPPANIETSLTSEKIAFGDVLRNVAQLTGTQYEITPEAILIVPTTTSVSTLEARDYKISFDAMVRLNEKAGFPVDGLTEANLFKGHPSLRDCLKNLGITFPLGAAAAYVPSTGRLLFRNTEDAIERLEVILDEIDGDEIDGDQKDRRTTLEEMQLEKQFRRVLKAKHSLSQKRLKKVDIRAATMQEIIDGVAEKLHCRLLLVQTDGVTRQPSMPGQPPGVAPSPSDSRLNLSGENVTLLEFFEELAKRTDAELIIGTRALLLAPRLTTQIKRE